MVEMQLQGYQSKSINARVAKPAWQGCEELKRTPDPSLE
jgi:hypothetical protein